MATLFAVDGMDDALAAMRGLLDAELTFPTIRAFDQQTERLSAKAAGAAPGAFCLCAGMLRRKLSLNRLPLQVHAAECVQADLALFNDLFPAIAAGAARRRLGLIGGPGEQHRRADANEHSAVHPELVTALPSPAQTPF